MNAMALAYLDVCGDDVVNSSTYLNSAADYSDAGALASVFADPDDGRRARRPHGGEGLPRRRGDGPHVRPAPRQRPRVPLRRRRLAARRAATRVRPARMECRQHEHAGQGARPLPATDVRRERVRAATVRRDGGALMVSEITTDTYIVAAVDDHIVPWRSRIAARSSSRVPCASCSRRPGTSRASSTRRALGRVSGRTTSSPPMPMTGWVPPPRHSDTWWNDWIAWFGERAGERITPPAIGSERHPVLGDAPGSYVRS